LRANPKELTMQYHFLGYDVIAISNGKYRITYT
jgi:hypothetical protein